MDWFANFWIHKKQRHMSECWPQEDQIDQFSKENINRHNLLKTDFAINYYAKIVFFLRISLTKENQYAFSYILISAHK